MVAGARSVYNTCRNLFCQNLRRKEQNANRACNCVESERRKRKKLCKINHSQWTAPTHSRCHSNRHWMYFITRLAAYFSLHFLSTFRCCDRKKKKLLRGVRVHTDHSVFALRHTHTHTSPDKNDGVCRILVWSRWEATRRRFLIGTPHQTYYYLLIDALVFGAPQPRASNSKIAMHSCSMWVSEPSSAFHVSYATLRRCRKNRK